MHNVRVPNRVRPALVRPALVRAVALAAATGLALAGCSGGDEPGADASALSSPSPSSTVSVPAGTTLSDQGSELSFGEPATVIFEPTQNTGTVLTLTVERARQASLDDFKGFIFDDDYKRNADYFYVDVSVENVGEGDVGGVPVPLWGVNAENTLLPAVKFTTGFKKCQSQPLPETFGPGDTLDTCLVYLSPDHGPLEAVSYRPSQEFNPIRWTGDIKPPKEPKKAKNQQRQ
jgi:hypothetical protein